MRSTIRCGTRTPKTRTELCPKFDVTFTALLEDLDQRGLLDETLVIAVAEFGRTPKINSKGGRDHWGPVFSFAIAGAGISGGQVYGASDKNGAYPAKDRVRPGELTATIFHLLGINYAGMFSDRTGRPHRLTEGDPLFKLLGTEPAAKRLQQSTGDIARVPPFDRSLLLNTQFQNAEAIRDFDGDSRPKGWRAQPLLSATSPGVTLASGRRQPADANVARIGFQSRDTALTIKTRQRLVLAQEVRSPFAGRYKLSMRCRGRAGSRKQFAEWFAKHFQSRLVFFQFGDQKKSPRKRRELASVVFAPKYQSRKSTEWQTVQLEKNFVNPKAGSNFSFGAGLGVAVIVETQADFEVPPDAAAFLEIAQIDLQFVGKKRIETVKV